ncbi:MAG TPA: hypothetical protein QF624_02570 [Dehalococcoidia bacterium]|nr:hypothetical protein [Dehalococcoidia bacterium]
MIRIGHPRQWIVATLAAALIACGGGDADDDATASGVTGGTSATATVESATPEPTATPAGR